MSQHRLPPKKHALPSLVTVYKLEAVKRDRKATPFDAPIITEIRQHAGELGWAITVHGSLQRDIDLVACPWTEDAAPILELLNRIMCGSRLVMTGMQQKPHGRVGVSLHALHGRCAKAIDLSIMPLRAD